MQRMEELTRLLLEHRLPVPVVRMIEEYGHDPTVDWKLTMTFHVDMGFADRFRVQGPFVLKMRATRVRPDQLEPWQTIKLHPRQSLSRRGVVDRDLPPIPTHIIKSCVLTAPQSMNKTASIRALEDTLRFDLRSEQEDGFVSLEDHLKPLVEQFVGALLFTKRGRPDTILFHIAPTANRTHRSALALCFTREARRGEDGQVSRDADGKLIDGAIVMYDIYSRMATIALSGTCNVLVEEYRHAYHTPYVEERAPRAAPQPEEDPEVTRLTRRLRTSLQMALPPPRLRRASPDPDEMGTLSKAMKKASISRRRRKPTPSAEEAPSDDDDDDDE